jgi:hypothetical protein
VGHVRWFDSGWVDDASLGFGDDFLGNDDDIIFNERNIAFIDGCQNSVAVYLTTLNLTNAKNWQNLDSRTHNTSFLW